ncbi:MAG: hypothetical protein GXP09_02400 [Gammaproteobacteria bacterium]|nr:hypothetical protein [Gammaproteobacteria bacterium]
MTLASLILFVITACEYSGQLKPFSTDGCSSFPDGPANDPQRWHSCCVNHDKAYWLGGNYSQRLAADNALKECISKIENPHLANIMRAGVRAGGSPFWLTSYRWGYGWPYTRGYRDVTDIERKQAKILLDRSP